MLSTASMETMEPMRRPRVSAPWHTNRAPPSSSTMAMCSGERKPSGATCSVVNETTWPTPRTLVGVMGTGCHGHHVAGGATTASQRGHREASIVSIIGAGSARPARTEGGLFEMRRGSARRRLPTAAWLRSTAPADRRSSLALEDGDPVVGGEAADRLREGDAARHLALTGAARELPHAFHDLGEARGGQRMAARLEPARRVDGQPAVEGC